MADSRDDSILFSLDGLMDVQKKRVEREHAARLREAEVALALQQQRERLRCEAEVRKAHSLAEAARLEAQRRREEDARLEALKRAAVETARIEVEARARLEMMEQQQAHERRMQELRETTRRGRARVFAVLGFGLSTLLGVASLGAYYGKLKPDAERLRVAYTDLVSAERSRADETRRLLERSDQRKGELERELQLARDRIGELERTKLDAAPSEKQPAMRSGAAQPSTGKTAEKKRCTDDGDPMNPCLK